MLIENSANLTLDGAVLEGNNLAISNDGGAVEIINSEIAGDITLVSGSITDNGETYSESGNYVQMSEEVFKIDDYALSITLDKDALKANESLTATVSIDKAYYSAEYTFTYDKTVFTCSADIDDDGIIYVTNLFDGQAKDYALEK